MENILIEKKNELIKKLNDQKSIIVEGLTSAINNINQVSLSLPILEKEIYSKKENNLPFDKELTELKVLINENITQIKEVYCVKEYIESTKLADYVSFGNNNIVKIDLSQTLNPAAKGLISSNNFLDLTWPTSQKKMDFTLENNDKTMKVNYSSCWNAHFLGKTFNSDEEETFKISVKKLGNDFTHHYIGFCDSVFYETQSCQCLYKPGFFMIHDQGSKIKMESAYVYENLPAMIGNQSTIYEFKIRAQLHEFDIIVNDKFYTTVTLPGIDYKFFVGKCNSANFEYTLLD